MKSKYALFSLMIFFLGAIAGAIVWFVLKVIAALTKLIWTVIPECIFGGSGELLQGQTSLIYNIIVCLTGAVIIGLFQRKQGILPDDMEQVIGKIKTTGGYPYNRLHIIAIAAVFPLIFGGALGPEAGLTGLIAGLCCWIGDSMKYRGHKLLDRKNVEALAETGIAVTLGVIFGAPLFGIIGNIEPDGRNEKYKEKILSKKSRIFLYCVGVAGGVVSMKLLGRLLDLTGVNLPSGLPRFERTHEYDITQWKWFILLLAAGIILAALYMTFNYITEKLAAKISESRIVSCIIPGVCVAFAGYYLPYSIFSGEHQMEDLIEGYMGMSAAVLIITAIVKMFLVNTCINFGWRGGAIFPIIFSGVSVGYAMAIIFGINGTFAVAIVAAATYAYIMRKPATVVAVLLLCFPVTHLIPIIVAAVIASKIPAPWDRKDNSETQVQRKE